MLAITQYIRVSENIPMWIRKLSNIYLSQVVTLSNKLLIYSTYPKLQLHMVDEEYHREIAILTHFFGTYTHSFK